MATMPCSGSSTSPLPVMMSEASRSATASIASRRRSTRSVRQSLVSSIAARTRWPWCFSSLASKRSNSVKASAVAPAKPASTWSWCRRRTLRAVALTTMLPSVTWPSPPSATDVAAAHADDGRAVIAFHREQIVAPAAAVQAASRRAGDPERSDGPHLDRRVLVDAHRAEEQRHHPVRLDEAARCGSRSRRASTQLSRSPAAMKSTRISRAQRDVDDRRRAELGVHLLQRRRRCRRRAGPRARPSPTCDHAGVVGQLRLLEAGRHVAHHRQRRRGRALARAADADLARAGSHDGGETS